MNHTIEIPEIKKRKGAEMVGLTPGDIHLTDYNTLNGNKGLVVEKIHEIITGKLNWSVEKVSGGFYGTNKDGDQIIILPNYNAATLNTGNTQINFYDNPEAKSSTITIGGKLYSIESIDVDTYMKHIIRNARSIVNN